MLWLIDEQTNTAKLVGVALSTACDNMTLGAHISEAACNQHIDILKTQDVYNSMAINISFEIANIIRVPDMSYGHRTTLPVMNIGHIQISNFDKFKQAYGLTAIDVTNYVSDNKFNVKAFRTHFNLPIVTVDNPYYALNTRLSQQGISQPTTSMKLPTQPQNPPQATAKVVRMAIEEARRKFLNQPQGTPLPAPTQPQAIVNRMNTQPTQAPQQPPQAPSTGFKYIIFAPSSVNKKLFYYNNHPTVWEVDEHNDAILCGVVYQTSDYLLSYEHTKSYFQTQQTILQTHHGLTSSYLRFHDFKKIFKNYGVTELRDLETFKLKTGLKAIDVTRFVEVSGPDKKKFKFKAFRSHYNISKTSYEALNQVPVPPTQNNQMTYQPGNRAQQVFQRITEDRVNSNQRVSLPIQQLQQRSLNAQTLNDLHRQPQALNASHNNFPPAQSLGAFYAPFHKVRWKQKIIQEKTDVTIMESIPNDSVTQEEIEQYLQLITNKALPESENTSSRAIDYTDDIAIVFTYSDSPNKSIVCTDRLLRLFTPTPVHAHQPNTNINQPQPQLAIPILPLPDYYRRPTLQPLLPISHAPHRPGATRPDIPTPGHLPQNQMQSHRMQSYRMQSQQLSQPLQPTSQVPQQQQKKDFLLNEYDIEKSENLFHILNIFMTEEEQSQKEYGAFNDENFVKVPDDQYNQKEAREFIRQYGQTLKVNYIKIKLPNTDIVIDAYLFKNTLKITGKSEDVRKLKELVDQKLTELRSQDISIVSGARYKTFLLPNGANDTYICDFNLLHRTLHLNNQNISYLLPKSAYSALEKHLKEVEEKKKKLADPQMNISLTESYENDLFNYYTADAKEALLRADIPEPNCKLEPGSTEYYNKYVDFAKFKKLIRWLMIASNQPRMAEAKLDFIKLELEVNKEGDVTKIVKFIDLFIGCLKGKHPQGMAKIDPNNEYVNEGLSAFTIKYLEAEQDRIKSTQSTPEQNIINDMQKEMIKMSAQLEQAHAQNAELVNLLMGIRHYVSETYQDPLASFTHPALLDNNPIVHLPLYGELPGSDGDEIITFEETAVLGNGDCGFNALGINREELVTTLMPLSQNNEVRKRLAIEIKAALQDANFQVLVPSEILSTQSNIYGNEQEISQLFESARYKLGGKALALTPSETYEVPRQTIIDWLQNSDDPECRDLSLQLSGFQVLEATNQAIIDAWCESEEGFNTYLQGLSANVEVGYESLKLYAELKNINLYIWRKISDRNIPMDQQQMLELTTRPIVHDAPDNSFHLFHTMGFIHYNKLNITDRRKKEEHIQAMAESDRKRDAEEDVAEPRPAKQQRTSAGSSEFGFFPPPEVPMSAQPPAPDQISAAPNPSQARQQEE